MNISALRVKLSELTRKELEKIIVKRYKSNSFNRELVSNKFQPENEEQIHIKYKKIVENEFFPERGESKVRYSVLRKALTDFKKISKNVELVADLMLFYVENGVNFTNEYGDIDEQFYIKIENMYNDALDFIFKNDLNKIFELRCLQIKVDSEGIGGVFLTICMIFFMLTIRTYSPFWHRYGPLGGIN